MVTSETKRIPEFETNRLICYSLSLIDYESFEKGEEPFWKDFTNPYRHLIEGPSPLPHRIPKVKKNPAFAQIGLILGFLKSTSEII